MASSSRTPLLAFALFVAAVAGMTAGGRNEEPPIDVAFFYQEICPSCEGYQKAEEIVSTLLAAGKAFKHVTAASYNTFTPAHAEKYTEILAERDLMNISHIDTVLIVDSRYIVGYEEIEIAVNELRNTGRITFQVARATAGAEQ